MTVYVRTRMDSSSELLVLRIYLILLVDFFFLDYEDDIGSPTKSRDFNMFSGKINSAQLTHQNFKKRNSSNVNVS